MHSPESKSISEVSWGYNFISKAVTASVVADSIAIYILLASFPTSCDASFHLKAWLLGCLCLSWPATAVSACISEMNFRKGFCMELALLACSLMWLMVGSIWCWESEDCMDEAPLLFWPIFVSTIFVWSTLILAMSCLIISTVLSLALAGKSPKPI
eukprot:s694_g18.t1